MKDEQSNEVTPEVQNWPRMYEAVDDDVEGSGSYYQTLLLTSSTNGGERVVSNFQEDFCNYWDENDFYLKDSIKLKDGEKEKILNSFKSRP